MVTNFLTYGNLPLIFLPFIQTYMNKLPYIPWHQGSLTLICDDFVACDHYLIDAIRLQEAPRIRRRDRIHEVT